MSSVNSVRSVSSKTQTLPLWPSTMPGTAPHVSGPERDMSGANDGLVAGKRVIRLGNVTQPILEVFPASASKRNGTSIVVCPGGGFNILAWDLEGTEIAEWLNKRGVTVGVLKYRVPTGNSHPNYLTPAIDTQRAIRLMRQSATKWQLDTNRVGVLGFSAGGKTAGVATLQNGKSLYDGVDETDKNSCRPDFAVLIYPAYFVDAQGQLLPEAGIITKDLPPFFLAHAADDPVTCQSSVALFSALHKTGVPAEMHLYESGGHGYGLRPQPDKPVTSWNLRCEEWMKRRGLVK
jgi:acetyl esterase/lipase